MRLLALTGTALFLVLIVYLIMLMSRMMKRSAWPGDSPQYRNHLGMARWIERQLGDDMVHVTIAEREKDEARRLLERFYGERQVGRGE